jgi:hypothetical protein
LKNNASHFLSVQVVFAARSTRIKIRRGSSTSQVQCNGVLPDTLLAVHLGIPFRNLRQVSHAAVDGQKTKQHPNAEKIAYALKRYTSTQVPQHHLRSLHSLFFGCKTHRFILHSHSCHFLDLSLSFLSICSTRLWRLMLYLGPIPGPGFE